MRNPKLVDYVFLVRQAFDNPIKLDKLYLPGNIRVVTTTISSCDPEDVVRRRFIGMYNGMGVRTLNMERIR